MSDTSNLLRQAAEALRLPAHSAEAAIARTRVTEAIESALARGIRLTPADHVSIPVQLDPKFAEAVMAGSPLDEEGWAFALESWELVVAEARVREPALSFPVAHPAALGLRRDDGSAYRRSFDAYPVLEIFAEDYLLRSRNVVFSTEVDPELGTIRIARYAQDGVSLFLHSEDRHPAGCFSVAVDMPGCVAAGRAPREVAMRFLEAVGLSHVAICWENFDLASVYAIRREVARLSGH